MRETERIFNVPYKRMTVSSMGDKRRFMFYMAMSFVLVIICTILAVGVFVVDMSNDNGMSVIGHILQGIIFNSIMLIIYFLVMVNLINTIKIYKDHKDIDLFLIDIVDSFI